MQFNWIDICIFVAFVYQAYDGWRRGSLLLIANLVSFIGSLWLAVRFHGEVGQFIAQRFAVSTSWSDVLGYIIIAFGSQLLFEEIALYGVSLLPEAFRKSKMNQWLGSALSLANTALVIAYVLLLIVELPLRGMLKTDVRASQIGKVIIALADTYGSGLKSSVEEIADKAVKFMTIEPSSKETIPIDIPKEGVSYTIDEASEKEMVLRVNRERSERNLSPLIVDHSITLVSREKSNDMFERAYFSHYDPDGKNAVDRMEAHHVSFAFVGENLAYAPDVASAHTGLMNSEGHRKNILDSRFHRIGIGVIDGGIYGKMFTQIFAD